MGQQKFLADHFKIAATNQESCRTRMEVEVNAVKETKIYQTLILSMSFFRGLRKG